MELPARSIEDSGSSSDLDGFMMEGRGAASSTMRSIESSGSSTAMAGLHGLGLSSEVAAPRPEAAAAVMQNQQNNSAGPASLGTAYRDVSSSDRHLHVLGGGGLDMEGTSSDYGDPDPLDDLRLEEEQYPSEDRLDAIGSACSALWLFIAVLVVGGLCVAALVRWFAPGEPQFTLHFAVFLTIACLILLTSCCAVLAILLALPKRTIRRLVARLCCCSSSD